MASFSDSEHEAPIFDPQTHTVTLSAEFKKSYRALIDSGAWALELPAELGGQVTPPSVQWAVNELNMGANPATFLYSAGPKFAYVLWEYGTERDKRIAQIMIERQLGRDHGAHRARCGLRRGSGPDPGVPGSPMGPGTSKASSGSSPPVSTI